ncbi:Ig-like domain-containing protein [Leifsonia aquatica]|uniref:Ig-like domain-containing protein n=1 Tax=Leifsonia aquatica TaxID=144185 RepID=UPI0028AFBE98|nr:Ig-like domain-containing protein [Leifsonia aquatica]
MNRSLRTFLSSATVAAMTSPAANTRIAPGQVFSGTADATANPGDAVTLVAMPLLSGGSSVCRDGVQIGAGEVGPGRAIEITAMGTVPDGLTIVYFCHDRFSGGNLYIVDDPFELRSPANGEGLPVDKAVVTGVGSPGAQADARTADGAPVGSAVVGQDGTWSVTLGDVAQGPATITFTQGARSFDAEFTIVSANESSPLVDPVTGGALAASALLLVLGVPALRRLLSAV